MRFVCSFCHTGFEADPAADMACPNCKAEAGLELVQGETPPAMRYFGLFLLVTAILAVAGILVGVTS